MPVPKGGSGAVAMVKLYIACFLCVWIPIYVGRQVGKNLVYPNILSWKYPTEPFLITKECADLLQSLQ